MPNTEFAAKAFYFLAMRLADQKPSLWLFFSEVSKIEDGENRLKCSKKKKSLVSKNYVFTI